MSLEKRLALGCMAAVLLGLGLEVGLSQSQAVPSPFPPFSHYRLRNGLQVILAEDYTLPLVSVVVTYRAGSLFDPPDKRGLAYLLENLMFLGSANVPQMQHIGFISRVGGSLSARVEEGRTIFFQTVPSNQLGLVLWLESDRMRFLQFSPSAVEASKNSLVEELRQRKAQDPYWDSGLVFGQLLYPDEAWGHSRYGHEPDLREITLEDAREFYETFYCPNNAVLCVSGNIDKTRARELISRYFESIPRGKEPPAPAAPQFFGRDSIVQSTQAPQAPLPGFHLGFRIAAPNAEDRYALTILDYILMHGRSSRLLKRILRKERLAIEFSGGLERRNTLAAYRLFGTANNDLMVDKAVRAIFAELQKVKSSFIAQEELAKAKNIFKTDFYGRLSTSLDKALFLSEASLTLRNLDDVTQELDRFLQVTPMLLVGLANRYLTRENSILLTVKTL